MFRSNTELKILFLLAGSLVVSSLFPAPLIYQFDEGESIQISCWAPRAYTDAWFDLFKGDQSQPAQTLPAAETHHHVTFLLENGTTSDGGQYRCQYRLLNGSQWQRSELSYILEITMTTPSLIPSPPPTSLPTSSGSNGPAWVLPTALSVTGVLLLVMILVVAVIAIGRFKERRKKKRELESCWTETSYPTTETSFDNSLFTVSVEVSVV
ncbi:protein HIDE1 [Elgaria multicarinata webbii]|uniref:protein HIDE1 n=1 Tax=Elgaria multicarinata webbii TaxID=159646 RepID=UPI002FCD2D10